MLIESMSVEWDAKRYEDNYRERVEELIDRKRSGAVVVTEDPQPAPAPVVDLFAALQASVSAARARTPALPSPRSRMRLCSPRRGPRRRGGAASAPAGSEPDTLSAGRSRRKPAGGESEAKDAAPAPAKTRGRKLL